jgi:hypothetical protein
MGSPYFASIGYASPLTPAIKGRPPDLPGNRAIGLHHDNHRVAELPSCVTPSLAYYRIGSHAPPTTNPEGPDGRVRMVSITGPGMGALSRAREYQPVIHRLRLSASP